MTETALPHLRVARRANGVALLTLDLPERRNAMSGEMTDSWRQVMAELRYDRRLRAVVVTGTGSAFCAGGDFGWLAAEPEADVDRLRERMLPFYRTWLAVRDLEVPTIAAVNGPAVGAGACLALACDLRYVAHHARISLPFTALGIHPGMAATWLLPEVVALPVARELLFTGRAVDGAEAVRIGLANQALDAAELLDHALSVADSIADRAPIATRLTKAALTDGHASLEDALRWEGLAQPVTMATEDYQEGLRAQRERRRPEFRGR